ncbi:unnamed protein product [Merluccius merluccius]
MSRRSDEIEMHIETSEYQPYLASDTEKIVPDCTTNSKRHLHLVFLSIGLLCFLQASLNISLRLGWKESRDPTSSPNLTKRECYTSWQMFSASCYYISMLRGNWQTGHQDCLERRAHLVIVNNRQELDFVMRLAREPTAAWIGMNDFKREGFWRWLDGTPVTRDSSYWAPGQPDDAGGEDCGEIRAQDNFSGFNDYNCNTRLNWICEKTQND